MSDVALAALFTAIAGIVASISAWYVSRGKTRNDFLYQFQSAVQKDLQGWKEEAKGFKEEAQKWRDEVYVWKDKANQIENDNDDLKRENTKLQAEVDVLKNTVEMLKQKLKDNNINGFS